MQILSGVTHEKQAERKTLTSSPFLPLTTLLPPFSFSSLLPLFLPFSCPSPTALSTPPLP